MSMELFTLILSRLVPLLFAASTVLIVSRLAYDRLRPRHASAGPVFALILLAGVATMAPFMWRAATLVSAEYAFGRGDWPAAAGRYSSYARLRGSSFGRAGARRAIALMNLGRYAEAETAFLVSFPPAGRGTRRATPNDILSLGLCRYYMGRLDAAERTVRAVSAGVSPVRDYVLGQVFDHRGDVDAAVGEFHTSLAAAPCFYPALYQLVRVLRREGRETEADAALKSFCPGGGQENRAELASLASGPAGKGIPPEREFYFARED